MKFTVLWTTAAEESLAAIWLHAQDRNRIVTASQTIDRMLADEPEQAGESRDGGRRIVHSPPLGVIFVVDASDRTVRILSVWTYDPNS